jgi:tRNA threonylcarbamoyladenosine modification (KEOPS) complex  Pcc1 subunit
MYSALIRLNLGKDANDYIKIMDRKVRFKRSRMAIKKVRNDIVIKIDSDDRTALLASINSVLKQIRVISNVSKLFE